MDPSSSPQETVVRLFPDYADTVLWLDGPIDYELTGLSESLVEQLRAWEESYYASLTLDLSWKSADRAARFTEEGNRLAQRVADEIGDGYEIEFRPYVENAQTRRFRGADRPNPRAVAAFEVLAAASRAEHDRAVRAIEAAAQGGITGQGESTGWYAFAPRPGRVFRPPPPPQEQPSQD